MNRMHTCSRFVASVAAIAVMLVSSPVVRADAYDGSPKLVIILIFDQFRGDYLNWYGADFKTKNGWNLFLKRGTHFTDCYYDYANLETAAGHSTIGTASYTNGHNVPINEWWEPGPNGKPRLVTSVQNDRYHLVGSPVDTAITPGASPHNELASTLGDELVLATGGRAKVFGVSLKDRAAILTSGHASRGAFWTDHDSGAWETSSYWMQHLPKWAAEFNVSGRAAKARMEANAASGTELRTGAAPNTAMGRRELNSYSDRVRWAVHMNFGAYQYPGNESGAMHYSANAYDRHVPLDLFGAVFVPGTYRDAVAPVDIAATFASVLRINQPSASVGRILTQVLRAEPSGKLNN